MRPARHTTNFAVEYILYGKVIWNKHSCYAAEILIGMNMAHQPVLLFHISAGFDVQIAAAGKAATKRYALYSSPVMLSKYGIVPPAQSTCIVSPGL